MAVRGPYQITLTTEPTSIDVPGTDNIAGTACEWVCYDSDWYAGGEDMTAVDGATPGRLIQAGQPHGLDLSGTDRYFGCVATGTATLHRTAVGV